MTALFRILDNGTLRTITRGWVKQAGVLRRLKTGKAMHGGTLRTVAIFADALTASASPLASEGDYTGSGAFPPLFLTADLVTAIPIGGLSPYTYSWTHVSGDTFTLSSPATAGTYFSHNFTTYGTRSGTYRCTVTDSVGITATVDVPVQIQFSF
jgi:hypothetical protein